MANYKQLWKGITGAANAEAIRMLAGILADEKGRIFIQYLGRTGAELCVKILDRVSRDLTCTIRRLRRSCQGIMEGNLKSAEKNTFRVTLRRLAELYQLLPDYMVITSGLEVSDKIIASGGFGDVRSGMYMGSAVAVKTAKVAAKDFQKIRKVWIDNISSWGSVSTIPLQRFYKEIILWRTLSHPNVLRLVGVQEDVDKREFTTVSEWMEHGTIMDYIGKNHANRLELVRDFTFPVAPPAKMQQ